MLRDKSLAVLLTIEKLPAMPTLPLGRLFWKFLIFFFLAQMTAVLGVGLAIWATSPDHQPRPPPPVSATAPADDPPPGPSGPPRPPGPRPPIVHLLAGAVVSLIFAALLAAYVSRPIRRLRLALQAGASGQLSPGVAAAIGQRRDELADLGHDFDRMAQHLAQLMAGQRRLLHDVSHELRSPLARLNATIGLARQQPERLDDCLARQERESMRIDALLSELLTLSRLESGIVERADEVVDLAELLADVVADAAPEAEQAACRVELKAAPGALVGGDAPMLHRLFGNLLRNALTHAAAGGWVGISVSVSGGEVSVDVDDRGPGVSGGDLERLFVPFYRATPASGKSGHGLGLAIARQIAGNHRGRVEAARRAGGGLRLSVSLPRAAAPPKAPD
jgi:signal transduction histidine kinase